MLDTNTAARKATLMAPPNASPRPRVSDSGMPSSSVPRKIAVPDPAAAARQRSSCGACPAVVDQPVADEEGQRAGGESGENLPARAADEGVGHQLVGDAAEQHAPAPKPITEPMTRFDSRTRTASTAPMTRELAARAPQKAATTTLSVIGIPSSAQRGAASPSGEETPPDRPCRLSSAIGGHTTAPLARPARPPRTPP